MSIDDLSHLPHPKWAIEGLFEVNSLVMLAGPEASYKSFMALDWMMCMATGRKWLNKSTTEGRVLYVLGEGKSSLLKRLQVWCHYHNISPEEEAKLRANFKVSFEVPQMASKASVDNMLAQLVAEKFEPSVIVIDTFARSFVGLDENSQKDTGLWIESADRLRQLGYTVIFLHHTSKNTEFGFKYRGSTAIAGAMDSSFVMHKDGAPSKIKFFCTKQKDHDEGTPMSFNRLIVRPWPDDSEGSIILLPAANIDERFTPEGIALEAALVEISDDDSFTSDRARGEAIAAKFGGQISANAARKRIERKRKGEESVH